MWFPDMMDWMKETSEWADDVLSKLRNHTFGDENETPPAPTPVSQSVYISFVGTFEEADKAYKPYTAEEYDAEWGKWFDENDPFCDFRIAERYTVRHLWLSWHGLWNVREVAYKDSLTVTVYDDPLGIAGWGVVIADCPDGDWFEAIRVNLNSFVGGAAVPDGCAVRILGR